jgi:hypothetical protein
MSKNLKINCKAEVTLLDAAGNATILLTVPFKACSQDIINLMEDNEGLVTVEFGEAE